MDDGGMDVAAVGRLLHQMESDGHLSRLKLIYCQSYYQNPTGLNLAADRRPLLVDLVRRYSQKAGHRIVLVEDAAYRELGYETEATLPSLKRYDPANEFVAASYTFSKAFSPGVKTGYCFLPRGLADVVLQQKGNHDFGSPNLCQALLRDVMAQGAYMAHLKAVRDGYRARRDLMLAALDRHLGGMPGVSWTRADGGLYVWLTLPPEVDTGRDGPLFAAAVARDVLYVPGAFCHQPDAGGQVPSHHMRLCYGVVPTDTIDEGIRRLAECIRKELGSAVSRSAARHRDRVTAAT
jgi:2-aminoadipate transaminase